MRKLVLTAAVIGLLATPALALIPARESIGFVSIVLDEGTEIIRAGTKQSIFLPWTAERVARSTEMDIALAWQDLLTRIRQDWLASVAACWFCAPGGWPTLHPSCLDAARRAVRERIAQVYQPQFWNRVETSLHQLPTIWWQSPRPGAGAVLACVAGESSPPYTPLLPDPYFHQPPPPPYPPRKWTAEPPGDPEKEALKETLLSGRPARIPGYQQIGYVVFLRTTGETVTRTFTVPLTGICVQCILAWCWPVTRTWLVTLHVLLQRATTDWPAVAEGYGIPGIR